MPVMLGSTTHGGPLVASSCKMSWRAEPRTISSVSVGSLLYLGTHLFLYHGQFLPPFLNLIQKKSQVASVITASRIRAVLERIKEKWVKLETHLQHDYKLLTKIGNPEQHSRHAISMPRASFPIRFPLQMREHNLCSSFACMKTQHLQEARCHSCGLHYENVKITVIILLTITIFIL